VACGIFSLKGKVRSLRIKPLGIDAEGLGFYCWREKR
jgi:hypothetical protein